MDGLARIYQRTDAERLRGSTAHHWTSYKLHCCCNVKCGIDISTRIYQSTTGKPLRSTTHHRSSYKLHYCCDIERRDNGLVRICQSVENRP